METHLLKVFWKIIKIKYFIRSEPEGFININRTSKDTDNVFSNKYFRLFSYLKEVFI